MWALPMTGEGKAFPILTEKFQENRAKFSPDGRWIVYTSTETGRLENYVQPFPPSGEKWRLSVDGGGHSYWRRDGKEIIFGSPGRRIMAVDVKAGTTFEAGVPRELFKVPGMNIGDRFAVTPDAHRFLFPLAQTADRPTLTVVLNWDADLRR
jgi:eukaryotic-like serine/threonine-protein kinase